MLPRLQAGEQLARIEAAGLGMGAYEQADRQAMMARLYSAFRGDLDEADDAPKPARSASAEQLGRIGIGVTIVPSKQAPTDER